MGPSALILCEFGQAWKGATAAENSSAGVRLVGYPSKVLVRRCMALRLMII